MKTLKYLRAIIVLAGILLGACAPAAVPTAPANVGGGKPLSSVIFTGVIESMDGDQWVINGQTIKVDSSVLRDGPFKVGDTVKVEASVADDGSVLAQRVETPSADDLLGSDSGDSSDDSSVSNDNNANQSLLFDDSGTEAFGTVEAMTDTSIVVGGQTFTLAEGAEIKGEILPGSFVKLEFVTNADGSLSVIEIQLADPSQVGDDNGNDDNSNTSLTNDDNSNDNNSNDDNGNDDNSNDDNSNDDHGNDDSQDDNGNNNGDDSNDNSGNGNG